MTVAPEQSRVFHISARSNEVGSDDCLSMSRLEGMHRAEPEGHCDSGNQPSSTQRRLMQELGQIICVHNASYFLVFGAGFGVRGNLADLLEVTLYKWLKHERNFIPMNLTAGLRVSGLPVGPRRLERLLGLTDLDHYLAGYRGGALA